MPTDTLSPCDALLGVGWMHPTGAIYCGPCADGVIAADCMAGDDERTIGSVTLAEYLNRYRPPCANCGGDLIDDTRRRRMMDADTYHLAQAADPLAAVVRPAMRSAGVRNRRMAAAIAVERAMWQANWSRRQAQHAVVGPSVIAVRADRAVRQDSHGPPPYQGA